MVARNDLLKAKLMLPSRQIGNMLSLIGNWERTFRHHGLKESHKNHGVRAQLAIQNNLLAGFFVPFELRLLDKEGLGIVPTRHFHPGTFQLPAGEPSTNERPPQL